MATAFEPRRDVRDRIDKALDGTLGQGPDPETWGATEEALAEADRFMLI